MPGDLTRGRLLGNAAGEEIEDQRGVSTDVTENVIRAVALPMGLVDFKVCAVDDIWSGLKLLIRKENREKA